MTKCRADCQDDMDSFLEDVRYVQGQYDEDESYEHLSKQLSEKVCSCFMARCAQLRTLIMSKSRCQNCVCAHALDLTAVLLPAGGQVQECK